MTSSPPRLDPAAGVTPAAGVSAAAGFSAQVRRRFGRRAATYEPQAHLQQAIAWRLGHLCGALPLPAGPRADLGAGTGLLSRALMAHHSGLAQQPPAQIDLCPELLARNPLSTRQGSAWDLNHGLPPSLHDAGLLASSFALQWLEDPAAQLHRWARHLAPGGWLVLAVPVAGSFAAWHAAARAAAVPCTALVLPHADALEHAVRSAGLELQRLQRLRFSTPPRTGLASLRLMRSLGATASRQPPLSSGQLRRLLAHWPPLPLDWQVLLLLGRRPPGAAC